MKRTRASAAAALPATIVTALAKMQDGLNKFIDVDWRQKRTPQDWALACTLEAAELIDSYPWKWWKNTKAQPDFNNVRVELVDILHFALAGTMQMEAAAASGGTTAATTGGEGASTATSPAAAAATSAENAEAPLIESPLADTQNAVKTFMNVITLAQAHRFGTITSVVVAAATDLEFNLVGYYIAKHTLNYIRQLGGYKDGTYAKVRQGQEDNELLHACIAAATSEAVVAEDSYATAWDAIMKEVYDAFHVQQTERRTTQTWMAQ